MEQNALGGRRALLNKIAIYAVCFINLVYLLPSVAMADLVAMFPQIPQATVMLTVSLPCLFSVAGILALPLLQSRFSLKRITLAALALSVLAGALSLLFRKSFIAILSCAALQGVSYGVFVSVYPLLNAARFAGEERASVMGTCTAMIQLGRLTILFFGGLLADIAWYYVFFLIGMVAVALLIVALFLTDCGPVPAKPKQDSRALIKKLFQCPSFWYLVVTGSLYLILYYNVATYASLYVQGNRLGTASATGAVSAIASGVAVFTSLASARVRRVTGRYTSAFAFLGLSLGLSLPGVWISLPAICIGMVMASIAKSQQMPYLMDQIAGVGDESLRTVAMSVVQTGINLGYFASPQITTFLGSTFGNGSPAAVFGSSGGAAFVIGLLMLVIENRRKSPSFLSCL